MTMNGNPHGACVVWRVAGGVRKGGVHIERSVGVPEQERAEDGARALVDDGRG